MFAVGEIQKSGFAKQSFLHKNLESSGKPTLHSLTADHVLKMSVKPKFQCELFEKKQSFALMVLIGFLSVLIKVMGDIFAIS